MFVGRRKELETLESAFASKKSALIPIYGRRRVGKSELILRFLRGRQGVYFLGKQTRAAMQIGDFLHHAAAVLSRPLLAELAVDDWERALTTVVDEWREDRKLVLVFDEFQWTVGASPELPSVLQSLWDREWKRTDRMMLILCGSYIGFMEREILGEKSPLFGRRTAQILLQPFGYREAGEFHRSYSLEDRAKTFFICGGIPWYLEQFDVHRSVEMNIVATLMDEHAPLYGEPDFLLREELRDLRNYHAVLFAVASGHATHSKLAQKATIDNRALHYYVQQLCDLGYLQRRYPLSDRRPHFQTLRYGIKDPLLKFWFRFVMPNSSFMLQMGATATLRNRIRPDLNSYFGSCFEEMCREALPWLYEAEGVTSGFQIGEYWDRDLQIDVVGLREDSWTDIGECRWGRIRSVRAIEEELDRKVGAYPNRRNASIGRRIFVRRITVSQRAKIDQVRWHSLSDLYEA